MRKCNHSSLRSRGQACWRSNWEKVKIFAYKKKKQIKIMRQDKEDRLRFWIGKKWTSCCQQIQSRNNKFSLLYFRRECSSAERPAACLLQVLQTQGDLLWSSSSGQSAADCWQWQVFCSCRSHRISNFTVQLFYL